MSPIIPLEIAQNIVSPHAYAEDTPMQEAFTWLRKEMPFGRAEMEGIEPFWVATKQSDIREIERQNELFHNGDKSTILTTIDADTKVREMMGARPILCAPSCRWTIPITSTIASSRSLGSCHKTSEALSHAFAKLPKALLIGWKTWARSAILRAMSPSSIHFM